MEKTSREDPIANKADLSSADSSGADSPGADSSGTGLLQEKPVIRRIAAYGLGLNAIWEFAQAGPLYDMWAEVGFGSGLFHITLAILGDALIVLGIAGAASVCVGPGHVLRCTWKAVFVTRDGANAEASASGISAGTVGVWRPGAVPSYAAAGADTSSS